MIGWFDFTISNFLHNQHQYPNHIHVYSMFLGPDKKVKDAPPKPRWQMRKQLAFERSICYWLWDYVGVPFQMYHTNSGGTMRELFNLLDYKEQSSRGPWSAAAVQVPIPVVETISLFQGQPSFFCRIKMRTGLSSSQLMWLGTVAFLSMRCAWRKKTGCNPPALGHDWKRLAGSKIMFLTKWLNIS